jgi:hypothetical protein
MVPTFPQAYESAPIFTTVGFGQVKKVKEPILKADAEIAEVTISHDIVK